MINRQKPCLGIALMAVLALFALTGCTDPASTGTTPICVPGDAPTCDPTATKVIQCHPTGANWMIVKVCPTNQGCENGVCAPFFRGPVPATDITESDTHETDSVESDITAAIDSNSGDDIISTDAPQTDVAPGDTLADVASSVCETDEECDEGESCESPFCLPEEQGECCDAWGGKGCNDNDCQDLVCNENASCCATIWNTECSALAGSLCGCLGDCCLAWGGVGCSNETCYETVCEVASTDCCNGPWNGVCAALAETECPTVCTGDDELDEAEQDK